MLFLALTNALILEPNYIEAHRDKGTILLELKRYTETLASYDTAISLQPNIEFLHGSRLHTKMQICQWDHFSKLLTQLTKKIENHEKVCIPFSVLSLTDNPVLQRKAAEIYIQEKYSSPNSLTTLHKYPKHPKIRIGYFSADFRNHPVAYLTAELFETHDRNKFEITAFSFGPDSTDSMRLRLENGFDHFLDVRHLSDKEVALLSRDKEIDIAIDLGGHTEHARTGIFALRAAPIQLSYIGYLGTMGAYFYDYLIADKTIIPEQNQQFYSEKIIYLPSYQVNDSKQTISDKVFTRKEMGLPETGFVFCCFNNNYKITPQTFDSWIRILNQVKDSVLFLYGDNDLAKTNLKKEALSRGLNPERLIFGKRLPIPEYLARYRSADLFLDTLPYNAGTTASDALRMGLPILTCTSHSFASRYAASLLTAVDLTELITTSPEQYEALAIKLATHPDILKHLKSKLSANLPNSPLYDIKAFTRHIESAYTTIYENHLSELVPENIYIT